MTPLRSLARVAIIGAALAGASCKDQDVPFLTGVTKVPNSPVGMQNGVTGLISATRIDLGNYIILSDGFARSAANFTNTEPRFITYNTGFAPITNTWISIWNNEYTDIAQARGLITLIPNIEPAYTAQQAASLTGIIQTIEAYNYMLVAEIYDTNGAAIQTGAAGLPPALCNKDVWAYIVSLLDSANAQLNIAGATPPPVVLPSGFNSVGTASGPSTQPGAFAAFNRALAGKAGLELAYAIARSAGGSAPTPVSPGSPDVNALTRADSAITSSALYNPGALVPNPTGGWASDNNTVIINYSSSSGDQVNPINGIKATYWMLRELTTSQDTVNDLRFKAKFVNDTTPIQQQSFSQIADQYHYGMYPSPGSAIPLARNEDLTLIRAEIQIGLTNYGMAATLINDVRTQVGGLPAATIANDFVDSRNAMMHEQQISTVSEPSGDRMIAIRMYGLAAVVDTTWGATDSHTTVDPIPFAETAGRGGSWVTTCP
jgi:hypothetical protein